MKIGYYPGCSLLGSSREYDESFRAIAPMLGFELEEVPDWNCCGASAAHSLTHMLAIALPARVLAMAQKAGIKQIFVPCSACYSRLATTQHNLAADAELIKQVSDVIEMELSADIEILNVLDALQLVAPETIKAHVTSEFTRKVACYYGCYLVRPAKITGAERIEDPQIMDDLLKTLGATPVDWAYKVECCGAGLSVSRPETIGRLSGRIVEDATKRGAEAIVVACPMCHTNLDLRRDEITSFLGTKYDVPVLYITQVLGKAFGISDKELGMHRHHVPVNFANVPVAQQSDPTTKIRVVVEEKK